MMSRFWIRGIVIAALAFGTACVPEGQDTMEDQEGVEQQGADEQGALMGEDTAQREQDSVMQQEQRRTTEELALRLDSLPGVGPYLTDGSGRALYVLEGGENAANACDEACEEEWPPFEVSSGMPQAQGAPIQEDLIGSRDREGEMMQVTYDGHPLYFYHGDDGPGDTQGQDVSDQWGEWYLVQPDGEPLEASPEADAG